jgi:hypothetical protein
MMGPGADIAHHHQAGVHAQPHGQLFHKRQSRVRGERGTGL